MARPPIRIQLSGSHASSLRVTTARHTISHVITAYTAIATSHTVSAATNSVRLRAIAARCAVTMASPDVATLANSHAPCARSRNWTHECENMFRTSTAESTIHASHAIAAKVQI